MKLSNKAKLQYFKVFGWACIAFGLIFGFDALQIFNDPDSVVLLNGVERTDAVAKLTVLFMPAIFILVGIILNLVSFRDVQKVNRTHDKFWSNFN